MQSMQSSTFTFEPQAPEKHTELSPNDIMSFLTNILGKLNEMCSDFNGMISDHTALNKMGMIALGLGGFALFVALYPIGLKILYSLLAMINLVVTLALTVICAPFSFFIVGGGALVLAGFVAVGYAHAQAQETENLLQTKYNSQFEADQVTVSNQFILTSTYYAITGIKSALSKKFESSTEKDSQSMLSQFIMHVDFGVSKLVGYGLGFAQTDYQEVAKWSINKAGFVASVVVNEPWLKAAGERVNALAKTYDQEHLRSSSTNTVSPGTGGGGAHFRL